MKNERIEKNMPHIPTHTVFVPGVSFCIVQSFADSTRLPSFDQIKNPEVILPDLFLT